MKTLAAGGAEALAGCARTVLWAISFHFVTSLGAGSVDGTARATPAPPPVAPAPAPTTKTSAATARTQTTQAERRVLIDVMTHLLLDDLGFVLPERKSENSSVTERARTNGLIAAPLAIA